MSVLSMRDLQKISSETIAALPGPTAVKAGERTVGVLVPIRMASLDRLRDTLARAEALAALRDPAAGDAALAAFTADETPPSGPS
jgi:hypothetical protein